MDASLAVAIVGAWIWLSVVSLTRVISERRRWWDEEKRRMQGCAR